MLFYIESIRLGKCLCFVVDFLVARLFIIITTMTKDIGGRVACCREDYTQCINDAMPAVVGGK